MKSRLHALTAMSSFLGLLLLAGPASAPPSDPPVFSLVPTCQADQGPSESCVKGKVWADYKEGWAVRTITTTHLGELEHKIYLMTLYEGNEYKWIACGDTALKNVDIALYDSDGRLLLQDQTDSSEPTLTFRPETTEAFYVSVHATEFEKRAKGKSPSKAAISLAVTYR